MFLRKAAIRPVPKHARVPDAAIEAVELLLTAEEAGLQQALDQGYRDLDEKQPILSAFLSEEVSKRSDELAQSLGYFLTVTVYLAFREAFPRGLAPVDESALGIALATLEADEALRRDDPHEVLESDDVIALGQPVVLSYIQHHLQEALDQANKDADLDELDEIYRAVLVEVMALSHVVVNPDGSAEIGLA